MIKKLMTFCALVTSIYSNSGSAREINLFCRYADTSLDAITLNLNLKNSEATSVALIGQYVGTISTYRILTTSNEYILKETVDIDSVRVSEGILTTRSKSEDKTTSSWALDRQNLKATWRLKIHGRLETKKEATCRIFEPENKI